MNKANAHDIDIESYEQARKELAAEKKTKNPDGRLTGYELLAMRNAIAGIRQNADGSAQRVSGIGDIKATGHEPFKSKLQRNLGIIEQEIEVFQKLVPTLSKQEETQKKEYEAKRKELLRLNAGKPAGYKGELTEQMVKNAGNILIYQEEVRNLDRQYTELLNKEEQLSERIDELFKKPLGKVDDFDRIHPEEIPPELSVNERQMLSAMLYKSQDQQPEASEKPSQE